MLYQPSEHHDHPLFRSLLDTFSVLRIEGVDSMDFLQGQLSQDVQQVTVNQAHLASYSSPKGRVMATLLIWQNTDLSYSALLPSDLATSLKKRLSMFILRAKVNISLTDLAVYGFWSKDRNSIVDSLDLNRSFLAQTVTDTSTPMTFNVTPRADCTLIEFPSHDLKSMRVMAIASADLPCSVCQPGSENDWLVEDILIGLPWVSLKTQDLFIAQSLNLDAIGAVNFKKGCYPGQEVIARSHYRGTLKRRTRIGMITPPIERPTDWIASDIYTSDDQIVGRIVNITNQDQHTYILFEVQIEAIQSSQNLLLKSPEAQQIKLLTMPYSLEKPE